jgi:RNA recognition motif-containing protein
MNQLKKETPLQSKPQTRVMGTVDLTVQVINISPKATKQDLVALFSYCGTVHEIKLEWYKIIFSVSFFYQILSLILRIT